jgi:16S rRNA A1518/A1519 N6-dimethyltransferase RsmA/KsgA/DIM1 with predicted DNA glycosylase/AP lyase activity
MLQKEVVERMVAENGSKTYGRLSVMMQAFFEVELIFTYSLAKIIKSSTLSISARCDKSMVVCCCNSKDFKQFPRVFLRKVVDMTFMLQKEVVERMVAENGSKTYGRLSVMMQAFFEVELIFTVPPESLHEEVLLGYLGQI